MAVKFLNWAGVGVNYPAGANPWSATPVEVAPAFTFFTPGVSLPSQVLNDLFGSVTRQAQLMVTPSLNTWTPATASTGIITGSALDVIAWDDTNRIWVAAGHTTGSISISFADGTDWIGLPNPIPAATYVAIGCLPSGAGFVLFSNGANIQFVTTAGVVTDSGVSTNSSSGGVAWTHPASNTVIGVTWSSSNHDANAYYTTNGSAYVNISGTLPATWSGGGTMLSMAYFTSATGPSNDQLIAFSQGANAANSSRMLHQTWNGSAIAFSSVTLPSALANFVIVGVAYNSSTGLWGAMVYDSVGAVSALYTSPDLVTWTGTGLFLLGQAGGLCCVGAYWIMSALSSFAGVSRYRAFASPDGVNGFGLGTSFVSAMASLPQMAQGPGNVAMWNVNIGQVSRRIG